MAINNSQGIFFPKNKKHEERIFLWMTDLHLDSMEEKKWVDFFHHLAGERFDALLVGGDIANGVNSLKHLKKISTLIERPLYFVLGNHDFYYGSIEKIRKLAKALGTKKKSFHYLSFSPPLFLNNNTALIGHDGWADAKAGNFLSSSLILNDYLFIDELKNIKKEELEKQLNALGTQAANHLQENLTAALSKVNHLILLMHTPPFMESCFYQGKPCDESRAPHFVCQAAGEVILNAAKNYPDKSILILAGHSHEHTDTHIRENVRVVTAKAILGELTIQAAIHF